MNSLDQTEQLLRTTLREAAHEVHVDAPSWPALSSLVDVGARRRRRVLPIVSVAAVVIVVASVVGALMLRDTTASRVSTSSAMPVQVPLRSLLTWEADLQVFMNVDATADQVASVRQHIRQLRDVRLYAFVDRSDALKQFRKVTANNPSLSEGIDASSLPQSVEIVSRSCAASDRILHDVESLPGVAAGDIPYSLSHADAVRYQHRDVRWLASHGVRGKCGQRLP